MESNGYVGQVKVGPVRIQKGDALRESVVRKGIAALNHAVPRVIAVPRANVLQKVADPKGIVVPRSDARKNDDRMVIVTPMLIALTVNAVLREIAVQKADALKEIVGLMRVVPRRVVPKVVAPTAIADQMVRAVR